VKAFFGLSVRATNLFGNEEVGYYTAEWCRGPESNWLRPPFQGGALPMSYPGFLRPLIILETVHPVNSPSAA
jgi:hypothetical protein